MSVEAKLESMGYPIRTVAMDNGKFVQGVRVGDLLYTAGQVSKWGEREIRGKVGADVSVEEAQEAARLCVVNNLSVVKTMVGSLERVERIVKLLGMVNVAPGFDDTPTVMHGASALLRDVFGERGHHARSAVGMTLPWNYAVEIEMIVQVSDAR